MLITLRIGLPVCPLHSPLLGSSANRSRRWRPAISPWWRSSSPHAGRSRSGAVSSPVTTRLLRRDQLLALGGDRVEQVLPRCVEGVLALLLEAGGERVGVEPGVVERGQDLLRVASVGRKRVSDLPVV